MLTSSRSILGLSEHRYKFSRLLMEEKLCEKDDLRCRGRRSKGRLYNNLLLKGTEGRV